MAKVHLHVTVDEDVDRQARGLAAASGLSLGAVVNMALKRALPGLAAALGVPPGDAPRLASEEKPGDERR